MIKSIIASVLKERKRIAVETQDNWDYGIEQCHRKCIDVFAENITASIDFFLCDCTIEDFYWLSETFEGIAEKTQSREIIAAWRSRLNAVHQEDYHQLEFDTEHMRKWVDYAEYVRSISEEIEFAEGQIEP